MSSLTDEAREWLDGLGFEVINPDLWLEALTHGSTGAARKYERLEFLGDRVLGLSIAEWLYRNSTGSEGELAQRLNALVSRLSCAKVARTIGVPAHVLLGKQARDDGAADSDNVLGDIMEALLGASFLESGFPATRDKVHNLWQPVIEGRAGRSKHPKSALQEWAAGNQRKPPEYKLVGRSGPDHAAKFTVRVSVRNVGEVEATANSKQDAETEAARQFMERYG
ncbi:ribonuclease III [Altererythrobacter sp. Root672]|uniref:ribonuclease III n=1 Tax=Altererythrobacter sp. Root672 TaxID=1736584 RepID=UPI0006F86512|nr:ribonuclease III [Altererythrobacter sp. Root672]KRA83571.1 ribonuclease III [Altererythrobacter sp. Root672]